MNVNGFTTISFGPPKPSRPSAASATTRFGRPNLPPTRDASRSATMKPTLCRLAAYSRPGLPRPTTSQGASSVIAEPPSTWTSRPRGHDPRDENRESADGTFPADRGSSGSGSGVPAGLGRLGGGLARVSGVTLELLGGLRRGDHREHEVGVDRQLGALGQRHVTGRDLRTGFQALDRDLEAAQIGRA